MNKIPLTLRYPLNSDQFVKEIITSVQKTMPSFMYSDRYICVGAMESDGTVITGRRCSSL